MLDGVSRGPSSNLPCGRACRACIAAVRGVRACDGALVSLQNRCKSYLAAPQLVEQDQKSESDICRLGHWEEVLKQKQTESRTKCAVAVDNTSKPFTKKDVRAVSRMRKRLGAMRPAKPRPRH